MLKRTFLFVILIYKTTISPLFPPCCRYSVSCSQYMYNCILAFGPFLGVYFGACRLLSCSPFFKTFNPHLER
ncbi:MAG: membrane protein insertion efficiency factor YidD [Gammaproteobacteria bacterium]|nr:membrane protein insertion efficiency factor YidD [Gammaproteobacteria bacterium]